MFSGFAVYVGDRLVLMLRDHAKSARDNGVWLVLSEGTDPTDQGLRRELHLRYRRMFLSTRPKASLLALLNRYGAARWTGDQDN
jgi:hypothetical protein